MKTLDAKVHEYMKEIAFSNMFRKDEDGNIEAVTWKEFEDQVIRLK